MLNSVSVNGVEIRGKNTMSERCSTRPKTKHLQETLWHCDTGINMQAEPGANRGRRQFVY